MERVSAIVVTRNGERFIAEALASIAAQTRPVDEIVVLDGASTDGTRDVALREPGVRLVAQDGTGLAGARNQAIAAATGDVIAFLDHDDRWTPRKIELQLALLRAGARPGMVIGALRRFGDAAAGDPAPRMARTPGVLLADRRVFERVGAFDTALATGCDMDWFARAALAGVPTATVDAVVLLKRLHGGNLSRDVARNRNEAFAVLAKLQALRRAPGG